MDARRRSRRGQGRSAGADGFDLRLAKTPGLSVQAGGGIRQTEDIDRLLGAGVQRVVVGTRAMEDWKWFESLAHEPAYAQKIILAVDAKDGQIAVRGWTKTSSRSAVDVARQVSDWPLAAILYTDVAKDGMLRARTSSRRGRSPKLARFP